MEIWERGKSGRSGGARLPGKVGGQGGSRTRPRRGNRPNPGPIGVDSPDSGTPGVPGTAGDPGTLVPLTVSLWKSSNRRSVCGIHFAVRTRSPVASFRFRSTAQGRSGGEGELRAPSPNLCLNRASLALCQKDINFNC